MELIENWNQISELMRQSTQVNLSFNLDWFHSASVVGLVSILISSIAVKLNCKLNEIEPEQINELID